MKHLYAKWPQVINRFKGRIIALFLDYDGTLACIAERPDMARVFPGIRGALKKLSGDARFRIAIVSGRALADIKRQISLDRIVYVGNHGLQIQGPKIRFSKPLSAGCKVLLRRIRQDLAVRLSGFKGVIIEDKGLSISVHYRLLQNSRIPKLKTILREAAIAYAVKNGIKVQPGKKVFEIRPAVKWDKGSAVLWLLSRWRMKVSEKEVVPVCIGDDATDHDAFRAIGAKGISILVGNTPGSGAKYYLNNVKEVGGFLYRLGRLNYV